MLPQTFQSCGVGPGPPPVSCCNKPGLGFLQLHFSPWGKKSAGLRDVPTWIPHSPFEIMLQVTWIRISCQILLSPFLDLQGPASPHWVHMRASGPASVCAYRLEGWQLWAALERADAAWTGGLNSPHVGAQPLVSVDGFDAIKRRWTASFMFLLWTHSLQPESHTGQVM